MSKTITIDDDQAASWEEFQKEEEYWKLAKKLRIAIGTGDDEAQAKLWPLIGPLPARMLKAAKDRRGAGYIRERGFDTSLADEKYGADWLDRDD